MNTIRCRVRQWLEPSSPPNERTVACSPGAVDLLNSGRCFRVFTTRTTTRTFMVTSEIRPISIEVSAIRRLKPIKRMKILQQFSAEEVKCNGTVFDKKGLATVFWSFRGKFYLAQKANGWQPRELPSNLSGQIAKDGIEVDREVMDKICRITRTRLLI